VDVSNPQAFFASTKGEAARGRSIVAHHVLRRPDGNVHVLTLLEVARAVFHPQWPSAGVAHPWRRSTDPVNFTGGPLWFPP